MLKRLSGLSRSAITKTRKLLGASADSATRSVAGSEKSSKAATPDDESSSRASSNEAGKKPQKSQPRRSKGKKTSSNKKAAASTHGKAPLIVPAGEHRVTRKSIGRSALKVLDKLHEAGHSAYLVGGGVRDALVGLKPKDFDVATDASPETIRALFRNSRIIGRRFRLVHVVFGREIIEVATFRAAHNKGEGGEIGAAGRIVRDNVFGTIEEDAYRRDFSVNALYYNIADGSVVDYVGGLEDLDTGVFKLIGDPKTRCEEDPVRVLRAVRLAAKLKFDIEPATLKAMQQTSAELRSTPPPRLFEEVLKLFQGGYALRSFHSVREHNLLTYLFPLLEKRLALGDDKLVSMLDAALQNTDRRVAQGKPITPAYLLAFMLWPDVEERAREECENDMSINDALHAAADSVLATQLRIISIPRRFSGPMKEIWQMQPRLERLRGGRALKLIEDRRFRAAYDFLCLRASVDERLTESAAWWTKVQTLPEEERGEAASKRPTVESIWPDRTGKGQRGKKAANAGRTSPTEEAENGNKPPARKRRRRRRRKPANGSNGSAPAS
ncbi:MAG: polynucleotide adenylyltransferase PcnB [Granulosicoccus sp.]